ncbi:MAG: hypothetical protein MUF87_14675 [Anaerolineae bacterium]|jgi:hypothetical protein|nr:hypothetical protein [Anaerolineae bacterium]
MNTILVQMTDPTWTSAALHRAYTLAQQHPSEVILLYMVPATPSTLGASRGFSTLTPRDSAALSTYHQIAKQYGQTLNLQQMPYVTLNDALAEAAEHFNARWTLAPAVTSRIPLWGRWQNWQRKQLFSRQQRLLEE